MGLTKQTHAMQKYISDPTHNYFSNKHIHSYKKEDKKRIFVQAASMKKDDSYYKRLVLVIKNIISNLNCHTGICAFFVKTITLLVKAHYFSFGKSIAT